MNIYSSVPLSKLFPTITGKAHIADALLQEKLFQQLRDDKFNLLLAALRRVSLTITFRRSQESNILEQEIKEEPYDIYRDTDHIIHRIDDFLARNSGRILSPTEAKRAKEEIDAIRTCLKVHLRDIATRATKIDMSMLAARNADEQREIIAALPFKKIRDYLLSRPGGLFHAITAVIEPACGKDTAEQATEIAFHEPEKMDGRERIFVPSLQYVH